LCAGAGNLTRYAPGCSAHSQCQALPGKRATAVAPAVVHALRCLVRRGTRTHCRASCTASSARRSANTSDQDTDSDQAPVFYFYGDARGTAQLIGHCTIDLQLHTNTTCAMLSPRLYRHTCARRSSSNMTQNGRPGGGFRANQHFSCFSNCSPEGRPTLAMGREFGTSGMATAAPR